MPTDPQGLRGDAPLFDAWLRFHEAAPAPFTIPGHKQRQDLIGDVVAGDVPLYAGLDTMRLERGVLQAAEARAAELWGADVARFSVGGSTHANQALALAVGREGDQVLVGRTLHRSMLLGLVLAGLSPVWLRPGVDPATGLPLGVTPEVLADGFLRAPEAVAVLVGDPSYVGTVADVAGLAAVAHAHDVPLVVDAAWAAHFGFHPDLPPHALRQGADALVTSAHKAFPAWSQAALILARGERIDLARLDAGVEATATTSPAGAILASIDASRALIARDGPRLYGALIERVAGVRTRLGAVPGLVVLEGPRVDPVKLTIVLPGAGVDGLVDRARPAGGRAAGRDGRPGHHRRGRHTGGRRRPAGPARRRAGREHRAPPRCPAAGGARCGLDGQSGHGRRSADGLLRATCHRAGRRGDRPDLRGTDRAVSARHPRAGSG